MTVLGFDAEEIARNTRGFSGGQIMDEDISEIIRVPLGTVKSRVNRARLRLQEDLHFLIDDLES